MTLFLFTKIVFGDPTDTFFGSYEFLNTSLVAKYPVCLRDSCVFFYPCNSNFTCDGIKLNIKKGTYLLEVWGAHAGYSRPDADYYGGYSYALVDFPKDQTIYLYIGGIGEYYLGDDRLTNKSFNGGGSGCRRGGGGATDFRVVVHDLSSRFLIAGGGAYNTYGGTEYGTGGGYKSFSFEEYLFGNGYSYSEFSRCYDSYNKRYFSGGGGGLYGGNDGGGSGFVYPIRRPPSIREITEFTVIEGETFNGLNSYIEGRAKISLYYNDNSNYPVNHKTCPFYESFGSRRRR